MIIPDFDFGTHPGCYGVLHALMTESGALVLGCDEDDAIFRHPDLIRSAAPVFPGRVDDYRIGDGLHLRPGTWRFATIGEVEQAGWEPFLRVELLVDVTGPPWLLPDGKVVTIGASTTRGDVGADSLVAHLALSRELGGRSVGRLLMTPARSAGSLDGLDSPVEVVGSAFPMDGSEAVDFTGTVRRWTRPVPGPLR